PVRGGTGSGRSRTSRRSSRAAVALRRPVVSSTDTCPPTGTRQSLDRDHMSDELGALAAPEQPPHREPRADRGVVVDPLERRTALHELLVQAGDGLLQVALVERAMLGHHVAHPLAWNAGPARGALAALRAAPVPGEHLRDALAAPAVLDRREPEVPVLR